MGADTLSSINTKRMREMEPTIRTPRTRGCLQPSVADSMNPNTNPAETHRYGPCPDLIDALGPWRPRDSGRGAEESPSPRRARGSVNKENPVPGSTLNQPPAEEAPAERGRNGCESDQVPIACPREFSSTKMAPTIARLTGDQGRRPDSLHATGYHSTPEIFRKGHSQLTRRQTLPPRARTFGVCQKNPHGATDQNQGRKKKAIGLTTHWTSTTVALKTH